jgi:hypothetical protein
MVPHMQSITITSIAEQCSLLLPLLWGAGPMALMLWLHMMMMMMMQSITDSINTVSRQSA